MGLQKAWESIIIPTSGYIELDTRHDEKPHLQETALYHIKINKINFTIKRVSSIETSPLSIIQTAPTLYYTNVGIDDITKNGRVLTDYNNARIKGTSITINDLAYEPNPEGHRLFMKNDLCTYEGKPRFRLFYRDLDKNKDTKQWHKDYEHYNTLYLHIGPSFTLDNLYT